MTMLLCNRFIYRITSYSPDFGIKFKMPPGPGNKDQQAQCRQLRSMVPDQGRTLVGEGRGKGGVPQNLHSLKRFHIGF